MVQASLLRVFYHDSWLPTRCLAGLGQPSVYKIEWRRVEGFNLRVFDHGSGVQDRHIRALSTLRCN
jgi:hypothetical protein